MLTHRLIPMDLNMQIFWTEEGSEQIKPQSCILGICNLPISRLHMHVCVCVTQYIHLHLTLLQVLIYIRREEKDSPHNRSMFEVVTVDTDSLR